LFVIDGFEVSHELAAFYMLRGCAARGKGWACPISFSLSCVKTVEPQIFTDEHRSKAGINSIVPSEPDSNLFLSA